MPKRKSTAEQQLSGGYRSDRHGRRADSTQNRGGTDAESIQIPTGLTQAQRKRFRWYLDHMPETVTVKQCDAEALANLVLIETLLRKTIKAAKKNPLDRVARVAWKQYDEAFRHYLHEFGLTPSSRSSVNVTPRADTDEVRQWLNRLGGSEN